MGYTIGMPSLKLSNIEGKSGKHCGNFRKVAKEALKERQGLDMDINPELAEKNIYIGYDSAEKLIAYSENHINELNKWRSEHGERVCDRRKLKKDTVVMCATIIKPPAQMMSELSDEQQHLFLQDSFEVFEELVGEGNVKSAAFHFDERVPHLHIFWEPMVDAHRICAKEKHNLKFFRLLNIEIPKRLREKGWSMVDDCQAYDKAEEEQKRLDMGEDKYREYRRALKANRGRDSRAYKHDVEQQIKHEQQQLIKAQNQRDTEERAVMRVRQQHAAEVQQSEALQVKISDQEQTYKKLRKKAKKAYDVAVLAREETQKANEELALQQQLIEQQKAKIQSQIADYNRRIQEIEQIRMKYIQLKNDFLDFINEEVLKIKSETKRSEIKEHINSNIRSRDEINAELDILISEIKSKSKVKERSFSL